MVPKRAVRKQQNISRPDGSKAGLGTAETQPPLLALLRPAAAAFNVAVARCIQDADPEAVHRLRTGSRRLQAMLEATLREAVPSSVAVKRPVQAWLRQLKQIRRSAGAVRDLDVHRNLLQTWLAERTAGKVTGPLQNQTEALDLWLKDERRRLGRGMQKQIRKRQPRLVERQGELFVALTASSSSIAMVPRSSETVALENFVRAAEAMPLLHAENLHEFRKTTKKARYLAESGGLDQSCVAKALKRIQDAIGEWHDWICLVDQAKPVLNRDAGDNPSVLLTALERELDHHFAAAIKTTESIRGQMFGEWLATQSTQAPPKRPPMGVAANHRRVDRLQTA